MSGMRKRSSWLLACLTLVAASAQAQTVGETPLGSAVERQLPIEQPAALARDCRIHSREQDFSRKTRYMKREVII